MRALAATRDRARRSLGRESLYANDVNHWLVTDSITEDVQVIRERAEREFGLSYGTRPKARWTLGES